MAAPIAFKTKAAMAAGMGVNKNTITTWTAKPDFPGGDFGPWALHQIVPWLIARQARKLPVEDPLLVDPDGDSPGLERYRLAKAALAELELEERKGGLLSKDKARSTLGRLAAIIRRLGERLGGRYGQEVPAAINESMDQFQRIVDDELGSNGTTDDGAA